ncbi:hypothetical protein [Aquariibacter albus]|uniref:Uncharacterized protein n=1 Tax=Aquariibacter albus TaxID=2759899 RepID=A0A839HH68_9BURK|nr:hypothetical protein [Aquariibacter albus]MBB1161053.1 hypothetical protein [Aquariibacter albus]
MSEQVIDGVPSETEAEESAGLASPVQSPIRGIGDARKTATEKQGETLELLAMNMRCLRQVAPLLDRIMQRVKSLERGCVASGVKPLGQPMR